MDIRAMHGARHFDDASMLPEEPSKVLICFLQELVDASLLQPVPGLFMLQLSASCHDCQSFANHERVHLHLVEVVLFYLVLR